MYVNSKRIPKGVSEYSAHTFAAGVVQHCRSGCSRSPDASSVDGDRGVHHRLTSKMEPDEESRRENQRMLREAIYDEPENLPEALPAEDGAEGEEVWTVRVTNTAKSYARISMVAAGTLILFLTDVIDIGETRVGW